MLVRLDAAVIERMAELLVALRERGGRLFVVGSGGGAGHASHAVSDFRKIAGIEAYSPSDNVSELTARINDEGWDSSYAAWLQVSRFSAADMLLVFSVGGGDRERNVSPNLVQCVDLARSVGATIAGVVGRDGGYTASVADCCVVVSVADEQMITAQVESNQPLIWHLLVAHPSLRRNEMRWESLR